MDVDLLCRSQLCVQVPYSFPKFDDNLKFVIIYAWVHIHSAQAKGLYISKW